MQLDEIKEEILFQCSKYIRELRTCTPGNILLRGYFGKIETAKKFDHNLDFRKPLNTPLNIHIRINSHFEERFGWKIRNGIFCYGFNIRNLEEPKDLGYGPFHICFPIGEYKFVYSPTVMDMYGHISMTRRPIDQIINEMDFSDKNLCEAIDSGDRKFQNVSNEISVCASSYYLINIKYKGWVDELIWK